MTAPSSARTQRPLRHNSADSESDGHTSNASTPSEGDDARHSADLSDSEEPREPSSGPQRKGSGDKSQKSGEKRKRSRVTPDQLAHLERFFAEDRSPPVPRRKEISEMLGMNERQTQIWFQNRRAKAKLLDGKPKGQSIEAPPEQPPELSTAQEVDLHQLLHEDHSISLINCQDLSIGTWRRLSTNATGHDLVTYICDTRRCLTWYIRSGGHGFKMEIPFANIVSSDFANIGPGLGLATFILSRPPNFFLENSGTEGFLPQSAWKSCSDWTEGMQATQVLKHELLGSAAQLAHTLRNLNAHRSQGGAHLGYPLDDEMAASQPGSSDERLSDSDPRRASTGSMPAGLAAAFSSFITKNPTPVGGRLAYPTYPGTPRPLPHSEIPSFSAYHYLTDVSGPEYENYATTNPYPLLGPSAAHPVMDSFISRTSSAQSAYASHPSTDLSNANLRRHSVHDMPSPYPPSSPSPALMLSTQFGDSMMMGTGSSIPTYHTAGASPAIMPSGLPAHYGHEFNGDMEPTPIANHINHFLHDPALFGADATILPQQS